MRSQGRETISLWWRGCETGDGVPHHWKNRHSLGTTVFPHRAEKRTETERRALTMLQSLVLFVTEIQLYPTLLGLTGNKPDKPCWSIPIYAI